MAPNKPTRSGDPVKENTSHVCPIFCIQVPIRETHCVQANKYENYHELRRASYADYAF